MPPLAGKPRPAASDRLTDLETIRAEVTRYWQPNWGSIAPDELYAVQGLIAAHRPADFLEIGTASGLSAGFIARFLDASGGRSLTSVDYDDMFFGVPDKPCGFQARQIYTGDTVDIRLHTRMTALDLGRLDATWQMAFVDGNHDHPWPTLDTLALWPRLTGPRIGIYHDLDLYMRQDEPCGIGPKYLFDQVPSRWRALTTGRRGNTFILDLSMERQILEEVATRALKLPWTLAEPLTRDQIGQIRTLLRDHYSPALQQHFETCLAIGNDQRRYRRGPFAPGSSLHRLRQRIARSDAAPARILTAAWRVLRGRARKKTSASED